MGKVTTGGTMSLDGFIAGPGDSGFDLLFQWYGNGDVEIPSASPDVPPIRLSAASAQLIKHEWDNTGALASPTCATGSGNSSQGPWPPSGAPGRGVASPTRRIRSRVEHDHGSGSLACAPRPRCGYGRHLDSDEKEPVPL